MADAGGDTLFDVFDAGGTIVFEGVIPTPVANADGDGLEGVVDFDVLAIGSDADGVVPDKFGELGEALVAFGLASPLAVFCRFADFSSPPSPSSAARFFPE